MTSSTTTKAKVAQNKACMEVVISPVMRIRLVTEDDLLALFNQPVARVQRDHVERSTKVTYLKGELKGNQLEFAAAMNAKTSKLTLIDGYTRCELLKQKRILFPKGGYVSLAIHTYKDKAELEMLYDQYNNPDASKKAPDRFQEGLRMVKAHGSLRSNLLSKGSRAAAVRQAANKIPVRDAVQQRIDGLKFVDDLMLTRRNETTAQLATYIVIGQYASHLPEAKEFIKNVNHAYFEKGIEPKMFPIQSYVDDYLQRKAAKALTGGGAVDNVFHRGLSAFIEYVGLSRSMSPAAQSASYSVTAFIDDIAKFK